VIESFCKGMSVGALLAAVIALAFTWYSLAQTGALLSIAAACVAFIHKEKVKNG
jgi:uncharacterized membrane protein YgaE (UPF0421/DUF939 family)